MSSLDNLIYKHMHALKLLYCLMHYFFPNNVIFYLVYSHVHVLKERLLYCLIHSQVTVNALKEQKSWKTGTCALFSNMALVM